MNHPIRTRVPRSANCCENCGSHDTQFLPVAYAQSFRRSKDGHESISAFGESLAPPSEKSVFARPLLDGLGWGSFVLLGLPIAVHWIPISMLAGASFLSATIYVPAIVAGVLAFFRQVLAAITYNTVTRIPDVDRWRNSLVCRRCAHTWHRAGSENHERGAST